VADALKRSSELLGLARSTRARGWRRTQIEAAIWSAQDVVDGELDLSRVADEEGVAACGEIVPQA